MVFWLEVYRVLVTRWGHLDIRYRCSKPRVDMRDKRCEVKVSLTF